MPTFKELNEKPAPVKTIIYKYPDFDSFYHEAYKYLNFLDSKEEEYILASYKYLHWLWLRWGYRRYISHPADFFHKFFSRFSSTFYEIRQKENLIKKIYQDIKLDAEKLIDIHVKEVTRIDRDESGDEKSSKEEDYDREQKQYYSDREEEKTGSRSTTKEKPQETVDLLGNHYGNLVQEEYMGRADWLSGEEITIGGYAEIEKYPKGHDKYGEIVIGADGKPSYAMSPNWVTKWIKDTNFDESHKRGSDRADHRKSGTDRIEKDTDTQQQPSINAQIARVLMAYKNFETYPTQEIESFSDLFCSWFVGGGEFRFNPQIWDFDFVPSETIRKIEKDKPKDDTVRDEPEIDPDKDLSEDEWKELWREKKKPCMPTWYLEQLYRYKKRTDKKGDKEDADYIRLEVIDTVMDAFYRAPYIPPLSVFEVQMGNPFGYYIDGDGKQVLDPSTLTSEQRKELFKKPWTTYKVDKNNIRRAEEKEKKIVNEGEFYECGVLGFADFKSKLYQELKVAHRRQKNKVPFFQVFPTMVGPPGTGKSEIATRLSKAWNSPLQNINCAGLDDTGEFEGKRPTLQNANYGKVLAGFVEKSILADVSTQDLEKEIKEIKEYKDGDEIKQRPLANLRDWELDRIQKIQLEIDEWKADDEERKEEGKDPIERKKKPYRSCSPIILLDEFEKISDQGTLDVVGKMTDREQNWSFQDKFFGFRIDLSRCWILMTANYMDKVPQFIKDRGLMVKIELLSWEQRLAILRSRIKKEMEVYKVANVGGYNLLKKVLGEDLKENRFLELLIPETWGVRGGINNVVATIAFLESLVVDHEDRLQGDLPVDQDPIAGTNGVIGNLWEPDRIEEEKRDDYLKTQGGTIKLIWNNIGGKTQILSLTKRIGIEVRTVENVITGTSKTYREVITGIDEENGEVFCPDWGGPRGKWITFKDKENRGIPDGLEIAEAEVKDYPAAKKYQWWYGYKNKDPETGEEKANKDIGYIVRSVDAEGKPVKEKPNSQLYTVREGAISQKREDDDRVYVIDIANGANIIRGNEHITINRIKLLAPLGKSDQAKYEKLVRENTIPRKWNISVSNWQKTAYQVRGGMLARAKTLLVYCRWELDIDTIHSSV